MFYFNCNPFETRVFDFFEDDFVYPARPTPDIFSSIFDDFFDIETGLEQERPLNLRINHHVSAILPPSSMQKTSLKVHNTYFSVESSSIDTLTTYLRSHLDELEKVENKGRQRPEVLAQIQAARANVTQAMATLKDVQALQKLVLERKNALQEQASNPEIEAQVTQIETLLNDLNTVALPKELTPMSVENYAKHAQHALSTCQKQFNALALLTSPKTTSVVADLPEASPNAVAPSSQPTEPATAPKQDNIVKNK